MDMFRRIIWRILEFFGWHCSAVRPIALEASPFRKLPLELVFLIASFLPPESAAVFSLSCSSFYLCLKTEHVRALIGAERSVMEGFLQLLERDLPTHIICPYCNKLHSMSFAELHQARSSLGPPKKPWLLCRSVDFDSFNDLGICWDFSSTIFRMVTKAYRQGYDTTKLLGLLIRKEYPALFREWDDSKCEAVARIHEGSLLIRQQTIYKVPSSRKIPIPRYIHITICAHIKLWTTTSLRHHGIQIPYSDEIDGYRNRQGIIYCDYCYTEFQVDFRSYGKASNAMFVTKWMDIGEGRHISDRKWRSRMGGYDCQWERAWFLRGSISAAFEQNARFNFDSLLTPEDVKNLCTKSPRRRRSDSEVSSDDCEQLYVVQRGRFVPLPI